MFVPVGLVIDSCRDGVFTRRRHPLLLYDRCRIFMGSELRTLVKSVVCGMNPFTVPRNPNVNSVWGFIEIEQYQFRETRRFGSSERRATAQPTDHTARGEDTKSSEEGPSGRGFHILCLYRSSKYFLYTGFENRRTNEPTAENQRAGQPLGHQFVTGKSEIFRAEKPSKEREELAPRVLLRD